MRGLDIVKMRGREVEEVRENEEMCRRNEGKLEKGNVEK